MTSSTEPGGRQGGAQAGQDGWRARALAAQDAAMAPGSAVLSCPAPFGAGGLGHHLQELALALDRGGDPHVEISESATRRSPAEGFWGDSARMRPDLRAIAAAAGARTVAPLGRVSPAWRIYRASVAFDVRAATSLPAAERLIAFNGTALAQFGAAARRGYPSRELIAANSHFRNVIARHELAHRQYPVEPPWGVHLLRRNLAEYRLADRIHVASSYIWESFAERGVPEERLSLFPLTPDPRFRPPEPGERLASDTFDFVYVGSLTVHKGIPLLLDAFAQLPHADARLVLVGGWKSRAMRLHIERAIAADPRVAVAPGDPLPHLRAAGAYVHPAYEDGFAYAPAEALACGVPVIVSEDTGMKDMLGQEGRGVVIATGDRDALAEAMQAAYRQELLTSRGQ
jgi:glycosyltransferase involved in cell wall biosynthesis